jgi:two-component sensor histidine kinase
MPERRHRILIIDEDESFCRYVSEHLEQSNFTVTSARNGEAAMEHLRKRNVDAVVLNHILPGTDGLTFLSEIRAQDDAPPVVYLTRNQESEIAVAALKAGAADYVVKDLHGEFLILLENAVTNAIAGAAIKRAKELAEEEVRKARDKFEALAEERALLLREVNHRVSNSLQLIASLLHFQGDISSNPDVKAALKEANGRVLAVARVHRSLYTSLDVRWVSLADYLSTLISDLQDVSAAPEHRDEISLKADLIQAGPDVAVAVGIVATELVLNALKHAYPNGQGPVRVQLTARGSHIDLTVEDEGADSEEGRHSGLGQRIIVGMADKLDGEVRYTRSSAGTRAVLTFPVSDEIRLPPPEAQLTTAA